MTKHTPEPWHANAIKNGRIIGGADAEPAEKIQINGANTTIATVYRGKDARLIAAAPALLAAATSAENWLTEYEQGPDTGLRGLLTQLREAIAKAEGGAG